MPQEAKQKTDQAAWQNAKSTKQTNIWHSLAAITPQFSPKGLRLILVVVGLLIVLNLLQVLLAYKNIDGKFIIFALMVVLLAGVVGVLLLELIWLYRLIYLSKWFDAFTVHRTLSNNLPLHVPSQVCLTLYYDTPPDGFGLKVMDKIPDNTMVHDLPVCLSCDDLHPHGVDINYTIVPFARGQANFDGVDVALLGRLGLLSIYLRVDEKNIKGQHTARVLVNFRQSFSGHLFAAAHRSAVDGLIHLRRRGRGQDFHQIRTYNEGDSIRHIDWRATSRLNRLMTKEYQEDQDQELLFLIDGSLHMRYQRFVENNDTLKQHSISHLDDVLNAMLLLTSVATAQGDSAGFISFSGINDKIVPAKKGIGVVSHLLNQSYDIQSSLKMPDYMAAAKMAMSLQKKRSLIILMTTTRSEDFDELLQAVNLLRAKHLVLVANIYESDFDDVMDNPPNTPNEAFRYHAVREHLNTQHGLKLQLDRLAHVYTIHCTPAKLAPLLIDNYLLMKRGAA